MIANEVKATEVPFLHRFLATGFFSGYAPVAPGTAGSLVGLLIYLIPVAHSPIILPILSVIFLFTGVYTATPLERTHGKDPSVVVIDEIVGMWISLIALPFNWRVMVIAFFLFRIFDIFKPPPARQLEKIPHGWGIMLDDVAAGVYTNIALRAMMFFFPVWFS